MTISQWIKQAEEDIEEEDDQYDGEVEEDREDIDEDDHPKQVSDIKFTIRIDELELQLTTLV